MARQPVYGRTEWDRIVAHRQHTVRTRILTLAAAGYTDHEIAEEMSYSVHTIKEWWKDIRRQHRARNRTHAVAIAVREGIIR